MVESNVLRVFRKQKREHDQKKVQIKASILMTNKRGRNREQLTPQKEDDKRERKGENGRKSDWF